MRTQRPILAENCFFWFLRTKMENCKSPRKVRLKEKRFDGAGVATGTRFPACSHQKASNFRTAPARGTGQPRALFRKLKASEERCGANYLGVWVETIMPDCSAHPRARLMRAGLKLRGRRKDGDGFQIDFIVSQWKRSAIRFFCVSRMFLKEARGEDSVLTACKGRETTQ